MFDILLSYCTNTLSFLRVGGFVLSHAALMLVVMTFAHMAGSFGSPIVVVMVIFCYGSGRFDCRNPGIKVGLL